MIVGSNTLTQRWDFGCCYLYSGKLATYRYKVEVTVRSSDPSLPDSMIIDFNQLLSCMKSVIKDGTYIYDSTNFLATSVGNNLKNYDLYVLPFESTVSCESICSYYAHSIESKLSNLGMDIVEVKLRENNNSYVTYTPAIR